MWRARPARRWRLHPNEGSTAYIAVRGLGQRPGRGAGVPSRLHRPRGRHRRRGGRRPVLRAGCRRRDRPARRSIFAAYSGQDAADVIEAYRGVRTQHQAAGPASLTETIDLTKLTALPTNASTRRCTTRRTSTTRRTAGSCPATTRRTACSRAVTRWRPTTAPRCWTRRCGWSTASPPPATLNQAFSLLGQIDSPRGTVDVQHEPDAAAEVVPAPAALRRSGAGATCSTPTCPC